MEAASTASAVVADLATGVALTDIDHHKVVPIAVEYSTAPPPAVVVVQIVAPAIAAVVADIDQKLEPDNSMAAHIEEAEPLEARIAEPAIHLLALGKDCQLLLTALK